MKYHILFFLALLSALKGYGQVSKAYVSSDGTISNDSQNAISYVLIQKVGDSTYQVSQYDMDNTILTKGAYKDLALSKPDGKFFYYSKKDYNPDGTLKEHPDTSTYVSRTGNFLNGLKSGTWVDYDEAHFKERVYHYDSDKLNGLYQIYNYYTGGILEEGNYINDNKEGNWNKYTKGLDKPNITVVYRHDKIRDTIVHFIDAQSHANFNRYIKSALKRYIDTLTNARINVNFSINEEGKIDSVAVNEPIDHVVKEAVSNAFLNAPKFKPATYDNKPMRKTYRFNFYVAMIQEDMNDSRQNARRMDVWGKHGDDVGRGLNSVGIGKPVN